MSSRPNTRREATEARLASLAIPSSGAWLRSARAAARGRLSGLGLPQKRDEYWRFTDPTSLAGADADGAEPLTDTEGEAFAELKALRIVFVDGCFDASASDDLAMNGVEIERLAEVGGVDLHWSQGLFGSLEAAGQVPVPRPLAALNTAFATDGVIIRVTAVAQRPIHLVHRHIDRVSDVLLHHVLRLEPGASLTVLESGAAASRFNGVMEVDLAEGAELHHVRMQGRDHQRRASTYLFARLHQAARLRSFTLTFNGRLTRNEAVVSLNGPGAMVHLAGAAVGDGEFHHDDTVFVNHAAPACESRQVFKKVLRNGAVGVFQGKIKVERAAQKTDGYQLAQALLLDESSQFLAKPELEIYADDVACSHGATAGAIDDTALFYLRSRGVPKRAAMDLLVLSFLQALDEVADRGIAQDLGHRLEAWLARRR